MKRSIGVTAFAAIFAVASSITAVPALSEALSSMFGVYVYPAKGQSQTQQANDESICYKSARSRTGVDPTNLPPATAAPVAVHQGGAVRGAAGVLPEARQSARSPAMRVRGRQSARLLVAWWGEDAKTQLTTRSGITRKPTPKRSGRRA